MHSYLLSQGYFQHSLWTQCKLLDGHHYKISSWKFEWFVWTDKGIIMYYILLLMMQVCNHVYMQELLSIFDLTA